MKKDGPILNSPRSIEACRRQGIEPHELIFKTVKELKKELGAEANNYNKEMLQIRWEHFEQRRKDKVKILM